MFFRFADKTFLLEERVEMSRPNIALIYDERFVRLILHIPEGRRASDEKRQIQEPPVHMAIMAFVEHVMYEFGILMPSLGNDQPRRLLQVVRGQVVEQPIEDECELIVLIEGDQPYERLWTKIQAIKPEKLYALPDHQREVIEAFLRPGVH